MYSKRILLLLLICASINSAQYIKVTKILDSNLFELEDGRVIKLAGIDAPKTNHPIQYLQNLSNDAIYYSTQNILDRRVFMEVVPDSTIKGYNLVFLHINYLFEKVNYNEKFLLYGYGKLINNVNGLYTDELKESELYAQKFKKGLWEYFTPKKEDILDEDLTGIGLSKLIAADSLKMFEKKKKTPLYVSIPFQLFSGSVFTIVGAYAAGISYSVIKPEHGEFAGFGAVIFGSAIGYLFGFPFGVYLVASIQNPNLSYWETLGFSSGLTLLSAGISYLAFPNTDSHPSRIAILFMPMIGSLLYVNFIAKDYPTKDNLIPIEGRELNFKTNKDFYNSQVSFRMEILRVYF
jgi:endonuclease YncB( thermonuclease family)